MASSPASLHARPVLRRPARAYWNPYAAGFALGLVLLATYVLAGRGLGATGAFSALVAAIAQAIAPEAALANAVHARYLDDGAPLLAFLPMLVLGTFVGGWIAARSAGRMRLGVEHGPAIGGAHRLAAALAGGAIVGIGAKIALGCTSGQALSGAAVLNVGSLVFMVAVFVAGYAVAFLVRRAWL